MRPFTVLDAAAAVAIAFVFVLLVSRLREPTRRRFNAIFVAGAGAAYLSGGGLGAWEFAFTAAAAYAAFRGLESYRWIAAAWLMHVAWDVAHHLWGAPIVPFVPTSSAGCAVTDSLLALWFWFRAPTIGPRR
ncbi:DUF6010 family protein [Nannocystis sp. SCPEA4]|uniref:DUF6010 family protein n=1 Tax=Nannocystis sp. SCPEA4 TaxID=2996787 RepID=UPI00226DD704|nr:DUF6010 family protein [Nannocystis sp. SCPEA4]MCY1059981.1 DUF6010 family protein [Nannocystis sp. SCPEA4]